MADKKISQLTGSTTPLAGTEEVPLVQSETTKKVSVTDLTSGRLVSMQSMLATAQQTAHTTSGVYVEWNKSYGDGGAWFINQKGGGVGGFYFGEADTANNVTVRFGVDSGGTFYVNDNLNISTASKGINFTANSAAAGMTSQLLNWYEEGTWTPTFAPSSGAFGSVTYNAIQGSRYTRVGNVVHIQGAIATDAITVGTASNNVWITGLPFTAVANTGSTNNGFSDIAIGYSSNFAGDVPSHGYVAAGTTRIELYYRTTANGASAPLNVSDLSTTDKNYVYFSATYICA